MLFKAYNWTIEYYLVQSITEIEGFGKGLKSYYWKFCDENEKDTEEMKMQLLETSQLWMVLKPSCSILQRVSNMWWGWPLWLGILKYEFNPKMQHCRY